MTEEQKLAYPEVILISAVRYAMCVDEPLPTEAVFLYHFSGGIQL